MDARITHRGNPAGPLLVGLLALTTCAVLQAQGIPVAREDEFQNPGMSTKSPTNSETIRAAIELLNSEHPCERDRAFDELKSAKLLAFDILLEAAESPKIHRRTEVERLILEMEDHWLDLVASPSTRFMLKGFHAQPPEDQFTRIRQLAVSTGSDAIPTLTLVCRYELDESLTRVAAANLLERMTVAEPDERQFISEQLRAELLSSRRATARCLAACLSWTAVNEAEWGKFVEVEAARLQHQDYLTAKSSQDFLIAVVNYLRRISSSSSSDWRALVVQQSLADNCPSLGLQEVAENLIFWADWPNLIRMGKLYEDEISDCPGMLLRFAHAAGRQGNLALQSEFCGKAFNQIGSSHTACVEIGLSLRRCHLDDMAEVVFRRVCDTTDHLTVASINAHLFLAELCAEKSRFGEAAEVLLGLLESWHAAAADSNKPPRGLPVPEPILRARWCFFQAEQARLDGDEPAQALWIVKGLQFDPTSTDLLTAALNCSRPTTSFRQVVVRLIDRRCAQILHEICRLESSVAMMPGNNPTQSIRRQLAVAYNRLAWLMSASRRSPKESIDWSRKAMELDPRNAHYIDTLAQCHFAAGNFREAIKYSRLALIADPANPTFVASLRTYEAAPRDALFAERDGITTEIR